ncbi:hypothetical protein HOY80DRAFT_967119 [Tuber brumale]|nr:hypothetical protein HOY80DRAFT_967119 [Tuber brumale]
MRIAALAALGLALLPKALANVPLDDAFVQNDMSSNAGFEIAFASRPLWHFGKSRGNKPCYPSPALINGNQHGTNPDGFPRAGTGCADPGPGGPGNPFPTYYTVNSCRTDELRVAYHIYFSHDGFSNGVIAKGHMHDWERIIVIWRRESGQWYRKELLKSFHTGYMHDNWDKVQNTFDYSNPDEQAGKNKEGAKIYVGWGKHAMFAQRNTGWNDEASQGCGREFRSADWWYLPTRSDLINTAPGSSEANTLSALNWGSADSQPWVVANRVCDAKEGGFTAC